MTAQQAKAIASRVLDRDTLLPVGVVVSLLALTVSITVGWMKIDARLASLEASQWTLENQTEWALRLQVGNTALSVPDVSDMISKKPALRPN